MTGSASMRASRVGAMTLLLLIAACGQPRDAQAPVSVNATTPVPSLAPSPSANPRAVAEREALAAYAGMIRAWVEAAAVADPDAPALRQFASGQALRRMVVNLVIARDEGRVSRGQPTNQPAVTGVSPLDVPTEVTLNDCLDDSNWLRYKAHTGEVWNDVPGGRHDVTIIVRRLEAGWTVDSFVPRTVGTC